jgi:hypothetical protein
MCCGDEQESLVSLLDVRDLLALRLVSRKTREWVDAVLSSYPTKVLALYVDEDTALHELVEEEIAHGIPFFRGLNVSDSSFFSHPLLPEFLGIYGSQIHTVHGPEPIYCYDVVPDEVAFYEALPNLTQLSTHWLGDNVPAVKMPALERLELHSVRSQLSESVETVDFDFLLHFPNLTHLWLPRYMERVQHVQVWGALGRYFNKRNGLKDGSSRRTLTIFLRSYNDFPELSTTEREQLATLLQELAVADGKILIENMNVQLLDEAVRLFHRQRGGQLLLSSFGKCIRSLWGFSSSLYEVELPNMRKLNVWPVLAGTKARDGDYSKTVSWPKLEEINMRNEWLAKLLFGSGVLRPSVKRLDCDLKLLSLDSKEAHLLLTSFPNVTHLTLYVNAEEVGLFRSVMRVLPRSCPKIQSLQLFAFFPLGDEDFLGVDEEGGLPNTTPPLLQLPGK